AGELIAASGSVAVAPKACATPPSAPTRRFPRQSGPAIRAPLARPYRGRRASISAGGGHPASIPHWRRAVIKNFQVSLGPAGAAARRVNFSNLFSAGPKTFQPTAPSLSSLRKRHHIRNQQFTEEASNEK